MLAVTRDWFEPAHAAILEYQADVLPDEGEVTAEREILDGEMACVACGHVCADDAEECPDCGIRLA